MKEEYVLRFIQNPILRGTWLPSSITRPQIPDRTKRIEGPRCEYEHVLNKVILYLVNIFLIIYLINIFLIIIFSNSLLKI